MKHCILGLLAETSIHPGAGRSVGVIDLPVAREAATDYPVIVGSSLKGALRQWASDSGFDEKKDRLFGEHDNAGTLLISDARLLLLPVRSLDSSYKWATCPHLLERFKRDIKRTDQGTPDFEIPSLEEGEVLASGDDNLFLEERQFKRSGSPASSIVKALEALIPHAETQQRLDVQLAILQDNDFVWFARYGLAVNARNQLDENKTSKNLWYEETLPPDSVFYALLSDRNYESAVDLLLPEFPAKPYLQAGGNETVGMGWFALQIFNGKEGRG